MSTSIFEATKYVQFGGLIYRQGAGDIKGEQVEIDDDHVLKELAMGRHPQEKIRGTKIHEPMSNLFNCFRPVRLSEGVEKYVTAFIKGEDFEDMIKADAKELGIDTAGMSVYAITKSVTMARAKGNEPEGDEEKLEDLNMTQLKDLAAELEIEDFHKFKKAELIKAIETKTLEKATEE